MRGIIFFLLAIWAMTAQGQIETPKLDVSFGLQLSAENFQMHQVLPSGFDVKINTIFLGPRIRFAAGRFFEFGAGIGLIDFTKKVDLSDGRTSWEGLTSYSFGFRGSVNFLGALVEVATKDHPFLYKENQIFWVTFPTSFDFSNFPNIQYTYTDNIGTVVSRPWGWGKYPLSTLSQSVKFNFVVGPDWALTIQGGISKNNGSTSYYSWGLSLLRKFK